MKRVFGEIRKLRPESFYIASDGPRDRVGEKELVEEIRNYILQSIDWECSVKTLFQSENLGCKLAVSGAVTWFFEQERMGIILEDDCLPHQNFFDFAASNLTKYEFDDRVWMISGFNYKANWNGTDGDYFFSKFGSIWGWATWSRCWDKYDSSGMFIPTKDIERSYENIFAETGLREKFLRKIKAVWENEVDTWDYQWESLRLVNNGLSIIPNHNLIENIGFGESATHTKNQKDERSEIKVVSGRLLNEHPSHLTADLLYDRHMHRSSLFERFKDVIRRILK